MSGYQPLSTDNKVEQGVPMYTIQPHGGPGHAVETAAAPHETHVHVTVGGPTAAAQGLYYGESHGLYQPISQNQIIERHSAPQPVYPQAQPQLVQSAAPQVVMAAPMHAQYPAQAYAQTYAGAPQGVPMGTPVPVQPPQQLVTVIPPVPQDLLQLKGMLHGRLVQFDMGRYFREGWAFTRQNFCFFFLALLMWTVVGAALYWGVWFLFVAAGWERRPSYDESTGEYDEGRGFQWGSVVRNALCEVLLFTPIAAGVVMAVFEAMKNNAHMKFRTLFAAFGCPYFIRLAGLTLVLGILTRLLSLLFVIPGVYFAVVSSFALPLHLQFTHIPLGAWQAVVLSCKTLTRYCCQFFGFLLVAVLLNVGGALLFGVGLFLTIPITIAAGLYCYHHLVGVNGMPCVVPVGTTFAWAMPQPQVQAPQQQVVVVVPQQQQ